MGTVHSRAHFLLFITIFLFRFDIILHANSPATEILMCRDYELYAKPSRAHPPPTQCGRPAVGSLVLHAYWWDAIHIFLYTLASHTARIIHDTPPRPPSPLPSPRRPSVKRPRPPPVRRVHSRRIVRPRGHPRPPKSPSPSTGSNGNSFWVSRRFYVIYTMRYNIYVRI